VAERRNLPMEKVKAMADGRILSGEQALALGLVDQLGGLEDSIELAAKMAGIKGKPRVLYVTKKRPSIFDLLTEKLIQRFHELLQDTHPRLSYIW